MWLFLRKKFRMGGREQKVNESTGSNQLVQCLRSCDHVQFHCSVGTIIFHTTERINPFCKWVSEMRVLTKRQLIKTFFPISFIFFYKFQNWRIQKAKEKCWDLGGYRAWARQKKMGKERKKDGNKGEEGRLRISHTHTHTLPILADQWERRCFPLVSKNPTQKQERNGVVLPPSSREGRNHIHVNQDQWILHTLP